MSTTMIIHNLFKSFPSYFFFLFNTLTIILLELPVFLSCASFSQFMRLYLCYGIILFATFTCSVFLHIVSKDLLSCLFVQYSANLNSSAVTFSIYFLSLFHPLFSHFYSCDSVISLHRTIQFYLIICQ